MTRAAWRFPAFALWLAATLPLQAAARDPAVLHELDVQLDPHRRSLRVTDTVELHGSGPVEVALGARYRIEHALLDGRPLGEGRVRGGLRVHQVTLSGVHRLQLRYAGTVAALADTDHRGTLGGLEPMASPRGSYLPAGSGWYAMVGDAPLRYRLTLHLPAGQRGLAAGRQVEEAEDASGYRARYVFDLPTDGIELMAGPYEIASRRLEVAGKPVQLRTWFHPEIAELSDAYLDATARYVERYSAQLGVYPFDAFGVVSSPLPTGFGMPTLTYLGIDVLRLPFIRATSLGHEVLHNWWGNDVYVDYAAGNWAEGLTTFMADYAYKEDEGADAARAMRLDWLRDFAAMPPDQDTRLRDFTSRTHGVSQIAGYNKAAFMFFMLRARLGADAFERGLRGFWERHRFQRTGWDDLRRAFEQASGSDLHGFFAQWLDRRGVPRVRIEQARRAGADLQVVLAQDAPAYAMDVPVELATGTASRRAVLRLNQARQHFVVHGAGDADTVTLDPALEVMRLLERTELPPILRNVMVHPGTRLATASDEPAFADAARDLAHAFLDQAPAQGEGGAALMLVVPLDAVDAQLRARGLPPAPAEVDGAGSAKVWTLQDAGGTTTLVIAARDAQALAALRRGLPHYGRQSWLVFDGARAIARGTWPARVQRITVTD